MFRSSLQLYTTKHLFDLFSVFFLLKTVKTVQILTLKFLEVNFNLFRIDTQTGRDCGARVR